MVAGRKPRSLRERHLRRALLRMDDPIALEESPLARLAIIERCAGELFTRRVCARGLALSRILHVCLRQVGADLGEHHPAATLARALDRGMTQASAAREIGISEEHLTRRWKPAVVALVLDRLEAMNHEVAGVLRLRHNGRLDVISEDTRIRGTEGRVAGVFLPAPDSARGVGPRYKGP